MAKDGLSEYFDQGIVLIEEYHRTSILLITPS